MRGKQCVERAGSVATVTEMRGCLLLLLLLSVNAFAGHTETVCRAWQAAVFLVAVLMQALYDFALLCVTFVCRFGLGFNAVYHLTDLPSFVSGQHLVLFDPHAKYLPGGCIETIRLKFTDFCYTQPTNRNDRDVLFL
jgi:hypothetical protein